MAVKRYINDEWVTISGLQGPEGNAGPTGDPGIVVQTTAPTNTNVLWLDTDETATINIGHYLFTSMNFI